MSNIYARQYLDACNNYIGWCTACKDFTRECTEPDAEGYDCPDCENDTVVGAENALVMGLISFDENVDDVGD